MDSITILIIFVGFAISVLWYGFRRMCPSCHRLFGLKKTDKNYHSSETRYRTEIKTTVQKDRLGNKIGSTETQEKVPYKVHYYKVTYKCIRCNNQVQRLERSGKYLKEAGGIFFVVAIILFGLVSNEDKNKQQDNKSNSTKQQQSVKRSNTENKEAVYNSEKQNNKLQNVDSVPIEIHEETNIENNDKDSVRTQ